jgi:diguanylate cyclase (GGDEF)-like protein/PAS domain S-box-containing protein
MSAAFAEQTTRRVPIPEDRITDDQLQLVRVAVERASEGIAIMTPAFEGIPPTTVYVNPAFCQITGMKEREVIGKPLRIFGVEASDAALHDAMRHPLCQRKPFEGEAVAVRKNGISFPLELLLVPVHDSQGTVVQWVAYLSDATERKSQIAALEHQALHDVLTGLPNRVLLNDRLEQALLIGTRMQVHVALMLIDLDRFKEINDAFGHHSGDLLLQQVAERLREQTQCGETVARLGGDEFAVLIPTVRDSSDALRMARRLLKAFQTPFVVGGRRLEVGLSVGIVLAPEHGSDASTLLRRADAAMYAAKKTGTGCSIYFPIQEEQTAEELALGGELREAIERNELMVFYQPKIDLRTGLVTRVEALSRWRHPKRGLLVPDDFIPLAERTGLIKPLTDWVLETSLRQCARWKHTGYPLSIAVNLSSKSLQEHFLPQTVSDLLDKWSVRPEDLKLEITESSIIGDTSHALAILSLLQTLGVTLSLDDFGTGYSSLMHLRHLPVDEIKIDKSFVMGMATNGSDAAIVRATIDLGHNLGRKVVAEGVADPATCAVLADLGCDLAQGFCFTPPLPPPGVEQWLTDTDWGITAWRDMMGGGPRRRRTSH